jgi:CheY-specific phosphatase CheX
VIDMNHDTTETDNRDLLTTEVTIEGSIMLSVDIRFALELVRNAFENDVDGELDPIYEDAFHVLETGLRTER